MAGIDYPPTASSVSTTTTEVVRGAFEIDLRGSGGTLSNGTVSLGGYNFTISGIAASSSFLRVQIPVASLFADFDGSKHAVEMNAYIPAITMSTTKGVSGLERLDSTLAYINALVLYEDSGGVYQQCGVNIDGSFGSTVGRLRTSTYQSLPRWGMDCNGGTISASFGTGASVPFRAAEQMHEENLVITDLTTYTERFGTGDVIEMYAHQWDGSSSAATVTQTAAGLVLTFGTQTTTFEKLYIYIGVEDIP